MRKTKTNVSVRPHRGDQRHQWSLTLGNTQPGSSLRSLLTTEAIALPRNAGRWPERWFQRCSCATAATVRAPVPLLTCCCSHTTGSVMLSKGRNARTDRRASGNRQPRSWCRAQQLYSAADRDTSERTALATAGHQPCMLLSMCLYNRVCLVLCSAAIPLCCLFPALLCHCVPSLSWDVYPRLPDYRLPLLLPTPTLPSPQPPTSISGAASPTVLPVCRRLKNDSRAAPALVPASSAALPVVPPGGSGTSPGPPAAGEEEAVGEGGGSRRPPVLAALVSWLPPAGACEGCRCKRRLCDEAHQST